MECWSPLLECWSDGSGAAALVPILRCRVGGWEGGWAAVSGMPPACVDTFTIGGNRMGGEGRRGAGHTSTTVLPASALCTGRGWAEAAG